MKTPRIVVVGSSNTDMVVVARRLPSPGETVTGGQFVMAPGGKGANQAVAAARLGAQVTFVAKVGTDVFGDQAVEGYRREGIDAALILRDPAHHTGVALILVDERGENLISVASGANHALSPGDVEQAAERIRAADALMLQLEIPLEAVERATELAAEAGVPVILDPAPAPDAPLGEALLRRVTYLTPNESEAQRLTGVEVSDEASARAAASRLHEQGVAHVIVTMGGRGALVSEPGGAVMVPPYRIEARDTTAAGDAFNGGLAVALGRGMSLSEAVPWASMVGALSATRLGAQPSLPTADEVLRFAERAETVA
jgi:ribokinase